MISDTITKMQSKKEIHAHIKATSDHRKNSAIGSPYFKHCSTKYFFNEIGKKFKIKLAKQRSY